MSAMSSPIISKMPSKIFWPPLVDESVELDGALSALEEFVNWEWRQRNTMNAVCTLAPIADLLSRLGNPQTQFSSIHVAGTKGKGSVSALVEGAIAQAGLNVGRYSSPHVHCFTERLTFRGKNTNKCTMASVIRKALDVRKAAARDGTAGSNATWFDLVTAACFLALADNGVDCAVIECGLGGRLDSTNIIDGRIAVITNIGLEHTEVLGSTRAQIASEKAGIIKPGAVVITTEDPTLEAGQVIADRAHGLGCQLVHVQPEYQSTVAVRNAQLAKAVLDVTQNKLDFASQLSTRLSGELSNSLVERCALPGRLERRRARVKYDASNSTMRDCVPVVLDGAHVPFSLDLILTELIREFKEGPRVVLLGLNNDKDAEGMIKVLAGRTEKVVTTKVGRRSFEAADLCRIAGSFDVPCTEAHNPIEAFFEACRQTRDGWLLVTGSLHLIGAVRSNTF